MDPDPDPHLLAPWSPSRRYPLILLLAGAAAACSTAALRPGELGESEPLSGWVVLIALLGWAGSAMFRVLDCALFSLDPEEIRDMGRTRPRSASLLEGIRDDLDQSWFALLSGAIFFNLVFALATVSLVLGWAGAIGPAGAVLGVVVAIAAVLVLGETLPALLAARWLKELAPLSARCLRIWMFILLPLSIGPLLVFRFVHRLRGFDAGERARALEVEKRLLTLVSVAQVDVTFEDEEREMIDHALEFADNTARDIMTARGEIAGFDVGSSQQELLELMKESPCHRLLAYDGSIESIRGVLHTKRVLLEPETDYHDFVDQALFVPEDMDLVELMAFMKEQHCQIVVVLDEYGSTAGVVSMNDLVAALVGPLPEADAALQEGGAR